MLKNLGEHIDKEVQKEYDEDCNARASYLYDYYPTDGKGLPDCLKDTFDFKAAKDRAINRIMQKLKGEG